METKKLIKILGFEPKENTTDVNAQFDPNKEEVVITLTTEIHDKLVELLKDPVREGGPK